jgi:glycine betaine/proline transport system permease protein
MATLAVPRTRTARKLDRRALVLLTVLAWIVVFAFVRGRQTLSLASASVTGLQSRLNDLNTSVGTDRNTSPFFLYFINYIQIATTHVVTFFQALLSQPEGGRPLPLIGWLGVVALATLAAGAFANARMALLTAIGLLFVGFQGLWQQTMDTLALTIAAVLVSLAIGIPLGIWAGMSRTVRRIVIPILDLMQTMPTFVYLAPLTLLFLIGPAAATVATVIYAAPPVIRLTAYGIQSVPADTLEAAGSLGSTRFQTLRKVMLPMAKRTVIVGVNQTTMAALSMVTIAALVAAPGLGQVVVQALESQDIGTAFNAGLAIVVIAVVLDRVTTAASVRVETQRRSVGKRGARLRLPLIGVGTILALVTLYLAYTYEWAASFPTHPDIGTPIDNGATSVTNFLRLHISGVTNAIKNGVTYHAINPLQSLLDQSPWWLAFAAILALAAILGGRVAALTTTVCLALIIGTGVWQDAMDTLAVTLVATVIVMVFSVCLGVWMGRSTSADRFVRPVLDAAQTMPAFVYLIPFLILFDASRFTGMVAAVVYAVPVASKIVADGIRAVSPTTVEAALSSGSSTWQVITKVQLPMSVRTLALATNQGLIYVLAMVVVGGLAGSGALGFDVVAGFSQISLFGKGLAAGVAIVLLGIMLDRITQQAALRVDTGSATRAAH